MTGWDWIPGLKRTDTACRSIQSRSGGWNGEFACRDPVSAANCSHDAEFVLFLHLPIHLGRS